MDTAKPLVLFVVICLIAFLSFIFLPTYVEEPLLDSVVTTGPGMMLNEWLGIFRNWAAFGIGTAWVSALLWFALGQWGRSLNSWRNAGKRGIWLLLSLPPLAAFIMSWLLTPAVQEGGLYAAGFYLANNILVYYLATLLCSPSSFKYTPFGASALRHGW
jgi:hypothetical protein